ncbi:MAG: recombinase family protein, partial [Rhodopirellula sp.]|nr:recombinase family protein [Rhodopirellula sp.]
LHIMQGRMYQAVLNKARRGDLYILPPIGYIKLPTGEFALDPDEQARNVIHIAFDAFDRRGTIRGVIRYLVEHSVMMPVRPHSGPNKGQLEWRRPTRDTVNTILTHPIFAGTYRYGHRQLDPRRKQPGKPHSGRVLMDPDDYHALIPGRCPAYISMERYERNQRRIAQNRVRFSAKGPAREGAAMLGGLVFCGHCDTRMSVHYAGKGAYQYTCRARIYDCNGPLCQSISGRVLDKLVAEKILAALQPAALEISLSAADDLQQERRRLEQTWQHRLERARYDAERAERQYQAVEPENRLVARTLEQQWESALSELQSVQQEYARFRQAHSSSLTDDERETIRKLSKDLPAVWNASTTSAADKQRIVQILLNRILVRVQDSTERVDVTLHWSGGFTSQHEFIRPVRGYAQLSDYERLIARIKGLRREGLSFAAIAEELNRDGFRPAKQAETFHGDLVGNLLRGHEGSQPGPRSHPVSLVLEENEWLAVDLAPRIGIAKNTLLAWIKRGWVHMSRRLPGYHGRVICWADVEELKRLCRLRETNHNWWDQPVPAELTTPKAPPKK